MDIGVTKSFGLHHDYHSIFLSSSSTFHFDIRKHHILLLYGLKSRGTCTLFALHVRLVWERWWFMCCHYLYHYFSIWCVTCLYCSCYILVLLIVDVYKMDVECEVLVHDPCIELLLCFVDG